MSIKWLIHLTFWLTLSLGSIYLLLPTQPLAIPGTSLDESWRIALQVAFDKGLVFGNDFIFTYGPLGFLSARIYAESTRWLILSYDISILVQLVLLWIAIYRLYPSVLTAILLASICFVLSGATYYLDPPIILFILSTTWLFLARETRSNLFFGLALADALLSFYIKVNLGLAALLQLLLLSTIGLLKPVTRKRATSQLIIAILAITLSVLFIRVDIVEYITASLHIANGFNDAMYLESVDQKYLLWSLATLSLLLVPLLATTIIQRSPIIVLSCIGFSFLLFKQAFVRSDDHIFVFFDYIVTPFALLTLLTRGKLRLCNGAFLVLVIGISIYQSRLSIDRIEKKWLALVTYQQSFIPDLRTKKATPQLNEQLISEIAKHSVDLMPDNTSLLYHAKLNYTSRPVIQSYSAYDSYLDQKNASFIKSQGQERIVYSHGCVDYRYCLHDEAETKLALLSHYDFVMRESEFVLLKRRTTPRPIKRVLIKTGKMRLGERISLTPSNQIKFIVFKIGYSLQGRLRRFFYKPDPLKITIATEDSKRTYRAIIPILNGGVIASHAIETTETISHFFRHQLNQLPAIKFIRLHSDRSRSFTKYSTYEIYQIEYQ